mgnify:CR=1 FL=1
MRDKIAAAVMRGKREELPLTLPLPPPLPRGEAVGVRPPPPSFVVTAVVVVLLGGLGLIVGSLGAALERLSAPQRLIVGLHYLEDFELAEIEQVTGLARGTIKSHLHRARQVLKQELTRRAAAGELL